MIRHLIARLVVVFLIFSCASDPQPKPEFQDGTRVGIFNSLEPYLTHRHITISRVNSFTKHINVDWDIPAYLNTQLADALKMDNFNWPASISNIPESELNKIRPRIKAYADQAAKKALTDAQMISAE